MVSLVTLGSCSSVELARTIQLSLPFAKKISRQWIFVLFSSIEISSFWAYLSSHGVLLDGFDVLLTFSSLGISASINEGVKLATCDWTLIIHSGDSLLPLDDQSMLSIEASLLDPSCCNSIHVFGTEYLGLHGSVSASNHCRPRRWIQRMLPWVPHESTFVPTKLYRNRLYNTNFCSAMDYEFFLYQALAGVNFVTHPLIITSFMLGGTSANIYKSCKEACHALVINNFCGNNHLSRFLSFFAFLYLMSSKYFFLLIRSSSRLHN